MSDSPTRIEADYTHSGPARPNPASIPTEPTAWPWTGPITVKRALLVLTFMFMLVAILLPFDGAVLSLTRRFQESGDLPLGGDLKREIHFVQQWGDFVCIAIVFAAVWLLDTTRRIQLWNGLLAVGFSFLCVRVFKLFVGRPRPKFGESLHFLTPFRQYEMTIKGEPAMRYSWEFWNGISSDLHSMPSGHTAAAVALGVVLMRFYPKLAPLMVILAIIVGLCRVVVAAHYPTDVVAGLAIGYLAASIAMDHHWGLRLARRLKLAKGPSPLPETAEARA